MTATTILDFISSLASVHPTAGTTDRYLLDLARIVDADRTAVAARLDRIEARLDDIESRTPATIDAPVTDATTVIDAGRTAVGVLLRERDAARREVVRLEAALSDHRGKLLTIGHVIDCFGPVAPEAGDPRSWLQYGDRIASAVKQVKYQVATLEADADALRHDLTNETARARNARAAADDAVSEVHRLESRPPLTARRLGDVILDVAGVPIVDERCERIIAALGSVALPSPVVTPPVAGAAAVPASALIEALEWLTSIGAHTQNGGELRAKYDRLVLAAVAAIPDGPPVEAAAIDDIEGRAEEAYWRFDSKRAKGTAERDAFKMEIRGALLATPAPAPRASVCEACNDTHRVDYDGGYRLCTICPVPCRVCRKDGTGPHCATTPCACSCHAGHWQYASIAPAPAPRVEVSEAAGTEWRENNGVWVRMVGPYKLRAWAGGWDACRGMLTVKLIEMSSSVPIAENRTAADAWATEQHAAMGRDLAQPAAQPVPAVVTVGELLATHPIGTIAEYNGEHDGADFRQTRITPASGLIESRWHSGGKWHRWRHERDIAIDGADLRKPARAVAPDDVDADPATRGDIARSITPPTSRRPEIGDRGDSDETLDARAAKLDLEIRRYADPGSRSASFHSQVGIQREHRLVTVNVHDLHDELADRVLRAATVAVLSNIGSAR